MKSDLTGMANANNQGDLAFPSANNSTPSMSMTGSQLPWATCLPSPPESGAGEDFFVAPTIDDAMALLGSSVPSPGMSEPLSSPLSRLNRPRSHSLSPHSSRPPLSPMMDGDNKRIKCPHCDKIFLRQYQLKSHMVSHSSKSLAKQAFVMYQANRSLS